MNAYSAQAMNSVCAGEIFMENGYRKAQASQMGGESGGEWIHVHLWLSTFAILLKLSQHS